jgi:hypothetical protein
MSTAPGPKSEIPVVPTEVGWTRRHVIFLSISAACAVLIVYIAHEILLPFILALVIAYVLTPLVATCEKRLRLPRSASILLVYAVVLGTLYEGIAITAPRLYRETAGLFREVPTELRSASERIGPQLDAWVDKTFPVAVPEPAPAASAPTPALEIKPQPDGSYAVEIGEGFDVVQVDGRRTRLEPRQPAHTGRVRIAKMLASMTTFSTT